MDIYVDGEKIHSTQTLEQANSYVKKNYKDVICFLEFVSYGSGCLDIWKNGLNKIMVVRREIPEVNVLNLLETHKDRETKNRTAFVEENTSKVTPCTPRRTRIKTTKKEHVSASKDQIITGKDGKLWISKEQSDGEYKWTRYYKEIQIGGKRQRKSPENPAKNYEENKVMTGKDGKKWIVKKNTKGVKKWLRK